MRSVLFFSFLAALGLFACNSEKPEESTEARAEVMQEEVFDQTKWREVREGTYPYREQMLEAVVYNDTIRSLSKTEILELLGKPDRENEDYLYYLISDTKLFAWSLSATYMVIKFKEDGVVEWIKIHN